MYERISVPLKLTYEVKTRPKIFNESVSKNISGSGICISLKEKLLPNTQLIVSIEYGNNKEVISFSGRVAWSRRVEISESPTHMVYYDTGIEIINPDPLDISRIINQFYGKSF